VAEAARAQERRLRARYLLPAVSYAVVLGAAVVALATTSAIDGLDLAATGGAVLMVIRALVATQPLQESWSQAREAAPFLAAVTERIERYVGGDRDRGEGTAIQAINRIELRRAGYSYPDGTVGLDAVDLTLGPGELLGVAGPSGGGKSTLGQVLLRLRRPDTGAMLVNGGPEADLADEHWSRLVAFVPQDPLVFDGTLAENIDFFRDLPASAVQEAARSAGLSTGDLTLDRRVGPGRGTLSGGQRQRVAIARALAGGPDLIVLDEPTSALDHDTEAEVLELIRSLRSRATLVVVSHRPAPLAICDRVIHLAAGRVVG
jgi:ABC-type multidrug transport system fused ATPase/permease subunit